MTVKAPSVWTYFSRNIAHCRFISDRKGIYLGAILLLMAQAVINAQDSTLEELPGLKERAVVMRIVSRIIEQNQQVVWNSENTRVTIPGRPVGLKLVGENLIVAVQFTPFLRSNGQHLLVAQGQIWINIPNQGVSYNTTMQTIPLAFNEQVYFFPLGSIDAKDNDGASIEIQLILEPYTGSSRADRGSAAPGSSDQKSGDQRSSPRRNQDQKLVVPPVGSDDTPQGEAPSENEGRDSADTTP